MTIKITLKQVADSNMAMQMLGNLPLPAKALFAVKKAVFAYREAFTIWQESAKPIQDRFAKKDARERPIQNPDGSTPLEDTAGFLEEMNALFKEEIEIKCKPISATLVFGGDKEFPFSANHLADLNWLFIDDLAE